MKMPEDIRYSGSTCSCVVVFGKRLYVANLGDSRAILVKKGNDTSLPIEEDCVPYQITVDHNLLDERERERIIENGGKIDNYRDKHGNAMGPERVWL